MWICCHCKLWERADAFMDTNQFFPSVYMGSVVSKIGLMLDFRAQHKLCICLSWILDSESVLHEALCQHLLGVRSSGENVEMAGAVRCFNISFQLTTFTCITLGFRLVRNLSIPIIHAILLCTQYSDVESLQSNAGWPTELVFILVAYKKRCWLCRDSEALPMKLRILLHIFDYLSYIKMQLPSSFMAFSFRLKFSSATLRACKVA